MARNRKLTDAEVWQELKAYFTGAEIDVEALRAALDANGRDDLSSRLIDMKEAGNITGHTGLVDGKLVHVYRKVGG